MPGLLVAGRKAHAALCHKCTVSVKAGCWHTNHESPNPENARRRQREGTQLRISLATQFTVAGGQVTRPAMKGKHGCSRLRGTERCRARQLTTMLARGRMTRCGKRAIGQFKLMAPRSGREQRTFLSLCGFRV